jgi:hypothetical protein
MRITAAMLTAVAVLYCPSRCSPSLMRGNKPRQAQMQIPPASDLKAAFVVRPFYFKG